MTISTTPRRAGPFPGNGVAQSFPFTFRVFAAADVLVVRSEAATGAEVELTLGTGYTVTLNADQKNNPGGSVALPAPLAAGLSITLGSKVAASQPADFTSLGKFYPRVLNDSLDRLTILVQQLAEQVSRSLKISFSSTAEATPDALLSALGTATAAATEAAGVATDAAADATAAAGAATTVLAGALPRDGSRAMTGPLTLAGNAASDLQAVPKQQAEAIAAAVRSTLASLTVTVNANAMTATLQPETLDFRSATLASGTPVSRSATVAASLTVPSGATLGTINGQAARIVWGWLDNAGTLEPFVANLAGGLNLDETTLISTTAISGTANSAGVAYSQTARNNVAFRGRGFCDITQATAGTWATAPSLVQGVGGMALAALASLGFGQTWQNVTGSRVLGTTYYNTTGKPISVAVRMVVNASADPIITITGGGVTTVVYGTGGVSGVQIAVTALIPPGFAYGAGSTTGVPTLSAWNELR